MDIDDVLNRAGDHLAVGRAFGAPIERDGTLLIPVALVMGGGGGGTDGKDQEGSGGGFGGVVYPLGAYVLHEGRASFVPAVNVTRILTAALLVVRVIARRSRRNADTCHTRGR